jgi:tetratricopeptide (TPR) repeat protein
LRALAAAARGEFDEHVRHTAREIGSGIAHETKVSRWLECAQHATEDDALAFVRNAVAVAFDDASPVADGPCFDRLYDTLQALEAWEDARDAICAHLARPGVGDARRSMLLMMLAEVLEEALVDLDGAQFAWEAAWFNDHDPARLEDIVRVASARGELLHAVDVQRERFAIALEEGEGVTARIEAGLRLAELIEAAGDGAEAVHTLEGLLHPPSDAPIYANLQRRLARLHVQHGDPLRAAELFETVLPFEANREVAADWRTLIGLYADRLDEPVTAYGLQWKLVRSLPDSARDVDDLLERAWRLGELDDCCHQLEQLAESQSPAVRVALLARVAESYDEELQWAEEAARLYRILVKVTDGPSCNDHRRRLAFALSRIAGKEPEALAAFRQLASDEPFEPTTYRGMLDLFERATAHDRARVAAQALRALGCSVDREELRAKTVPSRQLAPETIADHALPEDLRNGVFGVLAAAAPLAEKLWGDELPQRKALAGEKVRDGVLFDRVTDALSLFGIRRFRLIVGEAGPMTPQVFPDSTPTIWFNHDLVVESSEAELRFWAGWSAALAWSGIGSLMQLDGRRIWHMCEGAWLKQTGKGFTDRVDAVSQELAEEVGGALLTVMRRRLTQAMESATCDFGEAPCEAWPQLVEQFAARIGLLMAGDISAALQASLSARGWSGAIDEPATQKRVRGDAVATDVIRFALTDAYLHLRHDAGLSGPPSRLDVR